MADAELKKELELKKLALREQIAICQSKIAQIDSLLHSISNSGESKTPEFGVDSLRDIVEFAVKSAPVQFTVTDIAHAIALKNPGKTVKHQSIAATLWKLAREEGFLVVAQGVGNQPTIYRKRTGVILNEESIILDVLNDLNGLGKSESAIAAGTGLTVQQVSVVLGRRPEMFRQGADLLWRKIK